MLRSANTMLQESAVLEPEEQDLLSVILANLEMAARLYGSVDFAPESAKSILDLIERLVLVMGEHGLLHGHVDKPWEEEARRNGRCITTGLSGPARRRPLSRHVMRSQTNEQ